MREPVGDPVPTDAVLVHQPPLSRLHAEVAHRSAKREGGPMQTDRLVAVAQQSRVAAYSNWTLTTKRFVDARPVFGASLRYIGRKILTLIATAHVLDLGGSLVTELLAHRLLVQRCAAYLCVTPVTGR